MLETFSWDNNWADRGVSPNYEDTDQKMYVRYVTTAVIIWTLQ